jgi:hypothetical protein
MNHSDILYGGEPTSTEVSHESTGTIADRMYPSKEPPQGNTIISSGQYTPPEIQQRTASQNPATALYGDDEPYTPPAVEEVNENPLERKDRQGKSLYPDDKPIEFDIPEHIKELRNSPERLISGDNLGNTVNAELFNEAVQDPALAKALVHESKQVLTDLGFTQSEVPQIGYAVSELEKLGELTQDKRITLRKESVSLLRTEHGDRADQVYRDIVKLVNRDPRFANFLNQTNLGDSPRMASVLGRLAVKARNSGQLS